MDNSTLDKNQKKQLHAFAQDLQESRAEDLSEHCDTDFSNGTYRTESGSFYWPDGSSGSLDNLKYFEELSPKEDQMIEKFEDNSGFKYLDHGTGRVVLEVDDKDVVVKVGRWGLGQIMGSGTIQNLMEHKMYTNLESITDSLLPILNISDSSQWVVQPKVTLFPDYDTETNFEDVITDIKNEMGDLYDLIGDKKASNIGYFDDRWVLVDYGQFRS